MTRGFDSRSRLQDVVKAGSSRVRLAVQDSRLSRGQHGFESRTRCQIMLNGAPYELAEPCSVSRLLELLNMKGKPVVVEHNGAALLPQDFSRVTVSPGDRVEIVSIVAGG